jgi:peptidoglycan-associated lipoprotein
VKLAIKYSRPRRAAAVTATPSHVLLVGTPPKRLEHDLASAGHDVEVTPDPANHKKQSYDIIVVASNDQARAAHEMFADAAIVVRSGDVTADVRSIEGQAGHRPVRVASGREVVAAGPTKADPKAAATGMEQVGAKPAAQEVGAKPAESKAIDVKPETKPVEAKPVVAEAKPVENKPVETKPVKPEVTTSAAKPDETKPAESKPNGTAAALDKEVYFGLNASTIADKHALDGAVKWLKANADVHATVEGYADPTGGRDWNMALSQQRAEAVRDYLVAQGVDTARLEVLAFGDTKMKYGKTNPHNRRVAVEAKK